MWEGQQRLFIFVPHPCSSQPIRCKETFQRDTFCKGGLSCQSKLENTQLPVSVFELSYVDGNGFSPAALSLPLPEPPGKLELELV